MRKLQGAKNFPTWKERITRILDVSDAEEHIDSTKVAPTDPTDLAAWKKIDSRAMLIIMDGVKDHIVPHQGAQNYPTWKERITRILDFSDAKDHRSDRSDSMEED